MLNEYREYEIWTSGVTSQLKPAIAGKDGTGIRAAFKIIARKFLFDQSKTPDYDRAMKALLCYSGKLKVHDDPEMERIQNGLFKVIQNMPIDGEKVDEQSKLQREKKRNDMIEKFSHRNFCYENREGKINAFEHSSQSNNMNRIFFEDVIVEAAEARDICGRGPYYGLQNFCLVADIDVFNKKTGIVRVKGAAKATINIDYCLKFIASYLMNGGRNGEKVTVTTSEIKQWTKAPKKDDKFNNTLYQGEPVIHAFPIVNSVTAKCCITIHPEVIKHFEILTKEETDERMKDEEYFDSHIVYYEPSDKAEDIEPDAVLKLYTE